MNKISTKKSSNNSVLSNSDDKSTKEKEIEEEKTKKGKFISLYIINVLKKYSSFNSPVSISEILEKLDKDFSIVVRRSTISRFFQDILVIEKQYCLLLKELDSDNITEVNDFKIRQCYQNKITNEYIYNGDIDPDISSNLHSLKYEFKSKYKKYNEQFYYIDSELSENELKLLCEAVEVFSYISFDDTKKLLSKLNNLLPGSKQMFIIDGNEYLISSQKLDNIKNNKYSKNVLTTIEELRKIIKEKKYAEIEYGEYVKDQLVCKKSYPKKIFPYLLMWSNGYYYLIAKHPKYPDLVNYRVDRIISVTSVQSESGKTKVPKINDPNNLFTNNSKTSIIPGKYRATHVIMYSGDVETIEILCRNTPFMINTLYDCFGFEIKFPPFIDKGSEWIKVTIKSSIHGVILWATQYCKDFIVLSPQSVVDAVRKNLQDGLDNYAKKHE